MQAVHKAPSPATISYVYHSREIKSIAPIHDGRRTEMIQLGRRHLIFLSRIYKYGILGYVYVLVFIHRGGPTYKEADFL
jgi:hypothetical protein